MRRSLFAAAALGPIALAVAVPAFAATSIANNRTTPVATSTANNGQPDDVTIETAGTIKLNSGAAVTIDSNNSVSNAGIIQMDDAQTGATGVLIQAGRTGNFTNTGTISVVDNFSPSDSNNDGVFEAPLATGGPRYGVRVTGAGAFTGAINTGGNIFIEGNDSAGLSVESQLNGSITHTGVIGVTGDRSFGIRTVAPVTGQVSVSGSVSVSGTASTAVSIGADVGGALKVYSSVSSNGYSTSARSTLTDQLNKIQANPAEVQQAGSALVVGGNVAGGIFFGAPPPQTISTTTADNDGDGVADNAETASSIVTFGSAPALLIGGTARDIAVGTFGTGANAYGLISRGVISAQGLYDGVSATGLQIGGTGGATAIAGGVRLVGTTAAVAYEAPATGVLIGAGGSVPELRVENTLAATLSYSGVATSHTSATATGLLVQAGGSLPRLTNYGSIVATAQGPTASAAAIVDKSGTLSTVVNQGVISAAVTPATTADKAAGATTAIDLRSNTSGVSLTQSVNASPIALTGTTDSTGKFTATTTTPSTPSIVGDILLGNGPNTVSLQGGTVTGALSLGSGSASLAVSGGATYSGFLSHTNGAPFSIDVSSGSLINTNPATQQLSTLNVGATGTLSFAVDSANNRSTSYVVSGPATLASGAKVGVNLVSGITSAASYTLIRSPNLSVGSISSLTPQTPYVIIAGLRLDQAAGTLNLDLRRRTATEAGLDPGQTAAYDAVLKALPSDAAVQSALFAPQDRAGFVTLYNQMLPDYAGGVFRMASAAQRAIGRALGEGGAGGAWVQEISVGARMSSTPAGTPFKAIGFGLAGGVEKSVGPGSLGLKVGFVTGDSRNHLLPGADKSTLTDLDAGLYYRFARGGFTFDVGGGGGYVRSTYERQLIVKDATGATTLTRTAEGKSGGWSVNGRAGIAYQLDAGAFYIRPNAHLDYYRLNQGGYTETGGGNAFNLIVDSRKGSEASGTVAVALGAKFGQEFVWRPEIEVGYRSILSGDPGVTRGRFIGGDAFSIKALGLDGGGAMARLAVKAGNQLYDFSLSVGAEKRTDYVEGDFQVRARFRF